MTAGGAGEDAGAAQCSRCAAGATLMQMVRSQALWFAAAGRGDGTPPELLWKAVWAEDWHTVRSEWDKWVQPTLREMRSTEREWRATVAVMADAAARAIGEPFPTDIHDPIAVQRAWGLWIRQQVTAAHESVRSDEWVAFSQSLPAELRDLATMHPARQADLAATTFEINELHRHLTTDEGD